MRIISVVALSLSLGAIAWPQPQDQPVQLTNAELAAKIDSLAKTLDQTREELDSARAEIRQLRVELSQREALAPNSAAADALQQSVQKLEEEEQVLQAQVAQHDQTKVETASKYPLRVTGLLLFNSVLVNGAVDNDYDPTVALPRTDTNVHGGLRFTLRQSLLGVEANGPVVWGARTSAAVNVDFFGGAENTNYGAAPDSDSFVRLHTARIAADWQSSSAEVSYERPIFSPYTPASIAAVAAPALGWSGNLWQWLPQISGSHSFSFDGAQKLQLMAAVMDVPDPPFGAMAQVSAAERSRYPGSAAHVSYADGKFLSVGAGGYWSPHNYGYGNTVDAWAVTADWSARLQARLSLTGQIYRGAALGGLGGGEYKDVVQIATPYAGSYFEALHATGGWAQLHFAPSQGFEANGAYGMDDADSNQLRSYGYISTLPYALLARNQSWFGNVIYRPYASLLFSGEFREIRTWPLSGAAAEARVYSLSTGYQF